jgi:hypothetical protein
LRVPRKDRTFLLWCVDIKAIVLCKRRNHSFARIQNIFRPPWLIAIESVAYCLLSADAPASIPFRGRTRSLESLGILSSFRVSKYPRGDTLSQRSRKSDGSFLSTGIIYRGLPTLMTPILGGKTFL